MSSSGTFFCGIILVKTVPAKSTKCINGLNGAKIKNKKHKPKASLTLFAFAKAFFEFRVMRAIIASTKAIQAAIAINTEVPVKIIGTIAMESARVKTSVLESNGLKNAVHTDLLLYIL